jgi:hypothetical protein
MKLQIAMPVETMQILDNSQLDLTLPASHEKDQTRPSAVDRPLQCIGSILLAKLMQGAT